MKNITVQMNMSFDEFNKLRNGLPCYGYTQEYTTYPITIQVPLKYIKNVLDLSEGHNEYYEYEIEWESEEGINQLDPKYKDVESL